MNENEWMKHKQVAITKQQHRQMTTEVVKENWSGVKFGGWLSLKFVPRWSKHSLRKFLHVQIISYFCNV